MDSIGRIRESENATILIIDHDVKFISRLCDRIVVLNFGQKLAEGTPQEIKKNEAVRKAYLGEEEVDA